MKLLKCIYVFFVLLWVNASFATTPELVFKENSKWKGGFDKADFTYGARSGYVAFPKTPRDDKAWVFVPAFCGIFPNAEIALLKKGFYVVSGSFAGDYGNPVAVKTANELINEIIKKYKLNPKITLEGLSRGGAFSICYANTYPETVACLYLDGAVCDFASWPSRKEAKMWKDLCRMWNVPEDVDMSISAGNPINMTEPLAKAQIAIISVAGDSDKTVPHNENIEILLERFKAKGGTNSKLILESGKGHHPHGLKDPTPVVEFIEDVYNSLK
ncbi:MAG: hypothetical protein R3Y46_08350 [Opitutales bacterium]